MFEGPFYRNNDEGAERPERSSPGGRRDSAPDDAPVLYHRGLVESFERVCRAGMGRRGEIVDSAREFTPNDQYVFNRLRTRIFDEAVGSLRYAHPVAGPNDIHVRFLHQRVIRSGDTEEHHVFADVLTSDNRQAMAALGCFQSFARGPVAAHYMVIDERDVVVFPIISRPAFEETVEELYSLSSDRRISVHSNLALAWMMDSFAERPREYGDLRQGWDQSVRVLTDICRDVSSIQSLGTPAKPQFLVTYKGLSYELSMWFDPRLKRPVCFRGSARP